MECQQAGWYVVTIEILVCLLFFSFLIPCTWKSKPDGLLKVVDELSS
jgi:hypothetical protein